MGSRVGTGVGMGDGSIVGTVEGTSVGKGDGSELGNADGAGEGKIVGFDDTEGPGLGETVGYTHCVSSSPASTSPRTRRRPPACTRTKAVVPESPSFFNTMRDAMPSSVLDTTQVDDPSTGCATSTALPSCGA